jgi:SlyX protein
VGQESGYCNGLCAGYREIEAAPEIQTAPGTWRLRRAVLMIEERLVDIEMKITYQEDTVQELNKLVYQQQKRIAKLEQICESLMQHIRSLAEPATEGNILNERPPHF